ncbi:uncharacterized protein LOC110738511 [Chenopodium quinoa]|uniref:uncharacterized protein LOC110738511 n=1 Tax=Chenopodium quinoa TaxID=63459 RepID=UPI000B77FD15|nr:uncharacterized protein LOC110738511 [Chenopodium quinoa]
MKDILTRKRAFNKVETVAFTEEYRASLQNKSPPKLKDPGSFSIPCHIGNVFIDKALCDLGAIVSVMPSFVCSRLNMGDLKVTNITLQMADRYVKYPLDMAEDTQIPIILGRPFLHTTGAIIDVKNGKLTLSVGDDNITFNLGRVLARDPLEEVLCGDFTAGDVGIWSSEVDAIEKALALEQLDPKESKKVVKLVQESKHAEVKKPELKPLPSHLKYAFLDEQELHPMIISTALDDP